MNKRIKKKIIKRFGYKSYYHFKEYLCVLQDVKDTYKYYDFMFDLAKKIENLNHNMNYLNKDKSDNQ